MAVACALRALPAHSQHHYLHLWLSLEGSEDEGDVDFSSYDDPLLEKGKKSGSSLRREPEAVAFKATTFILMMNVASGRALMAVTRAHNDFLSCDCGP